MNIIKYNPKDDQFIVANKNRNFVYDFKVG